MSLAFFYLVIGDLIIIHQRAIFDYDAFAGQPFSKPDKTGKQNLYKLKDKKDRIFLSFLTFVSGLLELQDNQPYISGVVLDSPVMSWFINDSKSSSVSFRGPPSLL